MAVCYCAMQQLSQPLFQFADVTHLISSHLNLTELGQLRKTKILGADPVQTSSVQFGCRLKSTQVYTVFQKNGHPFCFCYNFVSRDQILVFFGSLVAKEICNQSLLTYLKVIAGALR